MSALLYSIYVAEGCNNCIKQSATLKTVVWCGVMWCATCIYDHTMSKNHQCFDYNHNQSSDKCLCGDVYLIITCYNQKP